MNNNDELRILKNFLDHMPKAYRARNINWVVVRNILMHRTSTSGRTSCCKKCVQLRIDPYGYSLESEEQNEID